MDQSQVIKHVEAHIGPLAKFLAINEWTIQFRVSPLQTESKFGMRRAEVDNDIDYLFATITINPFAIDTEYDVIDALYHELCHLVIAPYDLFYEVCSKDRSNQAIDVMWRVYTHAMERTIRTMEFAWKWSKLRDHYLDLYTSGALDP